MNEICTTIQGRITPTRDGGYIASAKHSPTGRSIKGAKRSTLEMARIDRNELLSELWAQVQTDANTLG